MRVCWYRRVLLEHWGCSAVSEEYYKSIREAELVQQSTTAALGMLRWYRSVLQKHSREAVLKSTIGALERLCWYSRVLSEHSTENYWSTREAVLVQQSTVRALGRLCSYSRVL